MTLFLKWDLFEYKTDVNHTYNYYILANIVNNIDVIRGTQIKKLEILNIDIYLLIL